MRYLKIFESINPNSIRIVPNSKEFKVKKILTTINSIFFSSCTFRVDLRYFIIVVVVVVIIVFNYYE